MKLSKIFLGLISRCDRRLRGCIISSSRIRIGVRIVSITIRIKIDNNNIHNNNSNNNSNRGGIRILQGISSSRIRGSRMNMRGGNNNRKILRGNTRMK